MAVSDPVARRLYILSGNQCAFPGCTNPILDTEHGVLTGQICHIKGSSPTGPRHDPSQPTEERDGFDNLILMCAAHNKIVDDSLTQAAFTVEILTSYKHDHEARAKNTVVAEDILTRFAEMILALQPQPALLPSVTPLIESYRTSIDHHGAIDYYCFRVSLRNDGKKTVREFRLEVEIPNAYANPTHLSSMSVCRVRGDMTVYTHTDKHFGNFALFPRNTSDLVMNTDYQMRLDQYKDATGSIIVSVYCDDDFVGSVDYSIRDNRNRDRMDQLGLTEG